MAKLQRRFTANSRRLPARSPRNGLTRTHISVAIFAGFGRCFDSLGSGLQRSPGTEDERLTAFPRPPKENEPNIGAIAKLTLTVFFAGWKDSFASNLLTNAIQFGDTWASRNC